MQLTPGTLLQNGKYKIIKVLGQGGFGITYLGEQVVLGREVAIKEFFMRDFCDRDEHTSHVTLGTKSSRAMVERFRQKFVKEAQTIAKLKHHNIIAIHDTFEENNTAYYVMEYIDSGSLSQKVGKKGLKESDAVRYIRQVASALSYLHDQKMNHLDVKPGNILIDEEDNTILIDFGLAKHYDEQGKQTTTTPVGISHGYAPTEQYRIGGVSQFSPATDIYSLGATLYNMLTGVTPPDANSIAKGLPTDELQARGVSPQLIHAITRAMKFDPDDRPQSIADFLALLDGKEAAAADNEGTKPVGDGEGILPGGNKRGGSTAGGGTQPGQKAPGGNGGSGSTTLPGGNKPAPRRSKKNLWVALAVVVGLICGVAGYTHFSGRGSAPAPAAHEAVVPDTLATDSIDVAEVAALIHNVTSPEEEATDQTEEMSRLQAENDRMREQLRQDSIANAQREAAAAAEARRQEEARRRAANSRTIAGHEWVDLGLPSGLKWATCNVGASSPTGYGNYYAWGETSTKSEYTNNNSTWIENLGDISGDARYDAARANWGGSWRMPRKAEFEELINHCTWQWTTQNGVNGCKVTGKNGNSIFLPAAGRASQEGAGERGLYWGSTRYEDDSIVACSFNFGSGDHSTGWDYHFGGRTVRPVSN